MDARLLKMLQARAQLDAQLNAVLQVVADPVDNVVVLDRLVVNQYLDGASLALDRFEEAARGA